MSNRSKSTQLSVMLDWEDAKPLIRMSGTLDFDGAVALRNTVDSILPSLEEALVIDCGGLRTVDSAGIGALVSLYRLLREQGKVLTLRELPPKVSELLRITKLDQLLTGNASASRLPVVQAVPVAQMPAGKMVHCWELKQCGTTDCVHYGKLGYLCWTSGTHCCNFPSLTAEDRILECFKCPVYQTNVNYISEVQDHFERYVSEAEQAFAKLRAERDSLGRELGKVRALLTASVDQSAEYIFASDPLGRLMLWNPALAELTGQSLAAITDISAAVQLLQPEGGTEAWTFMEFLEGRYPEGLHETALLDTEGEERVISWGCLKVKDSTGQPLGLLATGRDITEYRRAELALREIEERQRYVTENISEGLALLLDGRITYANQALATLLGYELDELEAMEFTQLFAPSRRDSARDFSRRSEEDGVLRYQSVALGRDGSEIHVEVTQGAARFHDLPAQIIMLRDASARRRMLAYERLIPICSGCGAIRDDSTSAPGQGSWHSLGDFIENTVESALTHTLCPHCAKAMHEQAAKLGSGEIQLRAG